MTSPPFSALPLSAWLAQAERDLERFERKLRKRMPRYRSGDRVSLFEDLYRVRGFLTRWRTGYELDRIGEGLGPQTLFLPLDLEPLLLPEPAARPESQAPPRPHG